MTEEMFDLAEDNRKKAKECKRLFNIIHDSRNSLILKAAVNGSIVDSVSIPSWVRRTIGEVVKERLDELEKEFKEL